MLQLIPGLACFVIPHLSDKAYREGFNLVPFCTKPQLIAFAFKRSIWELKLKTWISSTFHVPLQL
jgi:hypothetical protein